MAGNTNLPNTLYVVVGHQELSGDGSISAAEYLIRRYPNNDYGFANDGRTLFFKNEGHRNEFHRLFGGQKGVGVKEKQKQKRKLPESILRSFLGVIK
jgi:hypothetical protein